MWRSRRTYWTGVGAPEGVYDLLPALWLDVDGDDAITAADLPLQSLALPAALTVATGIFSDGFDDGGTSHWSAAVP